MMDCTHKHSCSVLWTPRPHSVPLRVMLTKVFALLICALNTTTNLAPGPADCYLNVRNKCAIDSVPRMVTQHRRVRKKTNITAEVQWRAAELQSKEESKHGMSNPKP